MGRRPLPSAARVRPGAHSARHQDSRNDLTPCRRAWHFVSDGAHAPDSDQTLGPTPTRGASHFARRFRSPASLCSSDVVLLRRIALTGIYGLAQSTRLIAAQGFVFAVSIFSVVLPRYRASAKKTDGKQEQRRGVQESVRSAQRNPRTARQHRPTLTPGQPAYLILWASPAPTAGADAPARRSSTGLGTARRDVSHTRPPNRCRTGSCPPGRTGR